jgi:hypothetical protein
MTQAYGTGDARSFEFAYEPLGVGLGGLDSDLISVTDPNGAAESTAEVAAVVGTGDDTRLDGCPGGSSGTRAGGAR